MRRPAPVIFAVLSTLAPSQPVAAGDAPRCAPIHLEVARLEPPPSQYVAFCDRQPDACDLGGPSIVPWSAGRHEQLQDVTRRVNAEIALVSDMDNLGLEEHWSFPVDCRGDCEDFVLEKRERLVAIGWPRGALTVAIVFHESRFFPHAVLIAETTAGSLVLDNLTDEVRCWSRAPYRWARRERPDGVWTRFRR